MKKFIITCLALVALILSLMPTATSAQGSVACEQDYIVQASDWLSKIAQGTYGDPLAYSAITIATNAQAAVLSRGLVGNLGERIVVASPIYKHHFDLTTGQCLEEPANSVPAWPARIDEGKVWIGG